MGGMALDDLDLALPRPAAPSPTQSHGTLFALLIVGFVVLAFLLFLSVRDVGPFPARIVRADATGRTASMTYTVTNDGAKAGRGNCSVALKRHVETDPFEHRFLTPRIGAGETFEGTITFVLPGATTLGGKLTC